MGQKQDLIFQAILKYIAYAQVFSYPATSFEIWQRLPINASYSQVRQHLDTLNTKKVLETKEDRWQLSGLKLLDNYPAKAKASRDKWQLLQTYSHIWPTIPGLLAVLVTGSLAANNATSKDDIDLCLITKDNRLWTARAVLSLRLSRLQVLRRFHASDENSQDLLCANLWLSRTHLGVSTKSRSRYTAHEVVLARPLYDPEGVFLEFRESNNWITSFLPNATFPASSKSMPATSSGLIETVCYLGQRLYMWPHVSSESISRQSAKFHPRPTSDLVLTQYHHNISMIGLSPDD